MFGANLVILAQIHFKMEHYTVNICMVSPSNEEVMFLSHMDGVTWLTTLCGNTDYPKHILLFSDLQWAEETEHTSVQHDSGLENIQ